MRVLPLIVLSVLFSGAYGFTQEKPGRAAPGSGGDFLVRDASARDRPARDNARTERFSREFFAGLKAKTLGDTRAAFDHFTNCVDLDPSSDAVWYELAILHYSERNNSQALAMINKAIAINDRQPWYLGLKADLLQKEGEYQELVGTFDQLIRLQPEKVDHYYNKAAALLELSRNSEALDVYRRIEQMEGPGPGLTLARQRVYQKSGQHDKALEEINELINRYPDQARYYMIRGELYDAGYRSRKALDSYQQALKLDPDNGYAHLAIADHYRIRGKNKAAFDELKSAFRSPGLRLDSKIKLLLNNYVKEDNSPATWAEGEELALILTEVYPKDARGYAIAGDIFLQQNKRSKAREAYRQAVKYEKNILLLWEQLLRLELSGENYAEIAAVSSEALENFPDEADFYLFNGVSNLQLGHYDLAITALNKGLERAAEPALKLQFYSSLGDAYHAIGDHAASDRAFDAALRLDKSNSLIMNNYAYYLAIRERNLEKAQRMSRQSIRLEPDNHAYHDTYAWVLYKAGNYEEACKWIVKAIEGFPHSPVFMEHYGDILFRLGEEEKALNMWNKAKELGGESNLLEKKIRERELYE